MTRNFSLVNSLINKIKTLFSIIILSEKSSFCLFQLIYLLSLNFALGTSVINYNDDSSGRLKTKQGKEKDYPEKNTGF